jgi:hypothetical protein
VALVSQWLKDFTGAMKREDLSPVTVRGYVFDLEMYIAWLEQSRGAKVRLNQISSGHIFLQARGLAYDFLQIEV